MPQAKAGGRDTENVRQYKANLRAVLKIGEKVLSLRQNVTMFRFASSLVRGRKGYTRLLVSSQPGVGSCRDVYGRRGSLPLRVLIFYFHRRRNIVSVVPRFTVRACPPPDRSARFSLLSSLSPHPFPLPLPSSLFPQPAPVSASSSLCPLPSARSLFSLPSFVFPFPVSDSLFPASVYFTQKRFSGARTSGELPKASIFRKNLLKSAGLQWYNDY